MTISYQSRFLGFWRQQWQQWQQQWQRQKWQWQSTLSGALQLVVGIMAQVWEQGLPRLARASSELGQRLLGSANPPPAVDQATLAVAAALSLPPQADGTLALALTPLPRLRRWWQRLPRLGWIRPAATALTPRPALYLACDRHHRSLMVVDEAANLCKVFNAQEQRQIEQRIYYELACYYRQVRQWYRRHHHWLLRWQRSLAPTPSPCLAASLLGQLTLTAAESGELTLDLPPRSPLGTLWQRWRSRLPAPRSSSLVPQQAQGIATLLETRQLVLIASDNTILYRLTAQETARVLAWIERRLHPPLALLRNSLQDGLTAATYWIAGFNPPQLGAAASPLLAATEPMPLLLTCPLDKPWVADPPVETPAVDPQQLILDVEAALIGYELHWFEQLLLWCDRLFLWLETQLARLGQWLAQGLQYLKSRLAPEP